ncbi:Uncharacterised protein [Streptococcus pneumoniae]|nr:Uncharacterised protein [Streptococcus pneumoniae]
MVLARGQGEADVLAQDRQLGVERVAAAAGGGDVAVADDAGRRQLVLLADVGDERHQAGVEALRRRVQHVQPLALDAERIRVEPERVDAEHERLSALERVPGAVAALHRKAAAGDGEVLPGVAPVVRGAHVSVLDHLCDALRRLPGAVRDVRCGGVVDHQVGGALVQGLQVVVGLHGAPLRRGDDVRGGQAGGLLVALRALLGLLITPAAGHAGGDRQARAAQHAAARPGMGERGRGHVGHGSRSFGFGAGPPGRM